MTSMLIPPPPSTTRPVVMPRERAFIVGETITRLESGVFQSTTESEATTVRPAKAR